MDKKLKQIMKKQFIEMYSELAGQFDSDKLPEEDKWKNDINVIADGMFDGKPADDGFPANDVMRYMILGSIKAEESAEDMLSKQDKVDFVMPETLMDLLAQAGGILDVMGDFDPSKLNLLLKKEVN